MPTFKATQHKPVSFDKLLLSFRYFVQQSSVIWFSGHSMMLHSGGPILGSGSKNLILIRLSGGPTLDD